MGIFKNKMKINQIT